ncbi:MAG: hypothetical protein ACXAEU_16590 [Candidatus Hodarchaeales archaeon]
MQLLFFAEKGVDNPFLILITQLEESFLESVRYNFIHLLFYIVINVLIPVSIMGGGIAHNAGGIGRTIRSLRND